MKVISTQLCQYRRPQEICGRLPRSDASRETRGRDAHLQPGWPEIGTFLDEPASYLERVSNKEVTSMGGFGWIVVFLSAAVLLSCGRTMQVPEITQTTPVTAGPTPTVEPKQATRLSPTPAVSVVATLIPPTPEKAGATPTAGLTPMVLLTPTPVPPPSVSPTASPEPQPVVTTPVPTITSVPTGIWGGEHIGLMVTTTGATVEYDCGFGKINEPLVLDKEGNFEARGIHVSEGGGPRQPGAPAARPPAALFQGWTDGSQMRLTVTLPDTGTQLGTFSLSLGRSPELEKCL
jgi:hypothetical protein